ncbi:MAG: hypothetical protein KC420_19575, partial [Myxococcales bacterium]|nr:hypothetical protein [Myxococcales bacterium]
LGKIPTAKALLPGGSTKVNLVIPAPADPTDYYVEVDKASEGNGDIPECHEDNNSSKVTAAQCPQPG